MSASFGAERIPIIAMVSIGIFVPSWKSVQIALASRGYADSHEAISPFANYKDLEVVDTNASGNRDGGSDGSSIFVAFLNSLTYKMSYNYLSRAYSSNKTDETIICGIKKNKTFQAVRQVQSHWIKALPVFLTEVKDCNISRAIEEHGLHRRLPSIYILVTYLPGIKVIPEVYSDYENLTAKQR